MNTGATHPFVEDYLARLSAESWRLLPHDQARELVEDVREHLASAITEQSSEAEIRDVLDRLGPPSEVVAAAAPEGPPPGPAGFGPPTPRPPTFGNVEVGALLCLVLAEVIFLIYPVAALLCLAGFVLLLVSRLWTAGEKVLPCSWPPASRLCSARSCSRRRPRHRVRSAASPSERTARADPCTAPRPVATAAR